MSLKDAIRTAAQEQKRQVSQQDVKQEGQNAVIPESHTEKDEFVNLTIRVTKRQRRHWVVETRKKDTSLTAAIIEALSARFGEPADE